MFNSNPETRAVTWSNPADNNDNDNNNIQQFTDNDDNDNDNDNDNAILWEQEKISQKIVILTLYGPIYPPTIYLLLWFTTCDHMTKVCVDPL